MGLLETLNLFLMNTLEQSISNRLLASNMRTMSQFTLIWFSCRKEILWDKLVYIFVYIRSDEVRA